MANLINLLETCWYISPPWGQQIPPLVVSPLERVYLPKLKTFGYCCGVEWALDGWSYAIALENEIVSVSGAEIVGSALLQAVAVKSPIFMVGEIVKFRFGGDGPLLRTVLGLHLINGSWFYSIEWKSPALRKPGDEGICLFPKSSSKPKFNCQLAWVTDYDLTGA